MNNDVQFCPECGTMSRRRIESRHETHIVRGESIEVEADVAVCLHCGADVADKDLDDATLERAYDEYRRRFGILTPDQIRALRESCGLSQRGFSRLLGWGDLTVHRYEIGALPDLAHNTLLVALQDEDTLYRFIERRQTYISSLDRRRLRAAMNGRLPQIGTASIRRGLQQLIEAHPLVERGNRPFDLERIGHIIVYFASRGRPTTTKLNKLLFFADFLLFKRLSIALGGLPYLRYRYGPVPDHYKLIFAEVEDEGYVSAEPFVMETASGYYEGTEYEARVAFDASLFTADEIDVLETVHTRLMHLNTSQVKDLSHQEQAWKDAPEMQVIPYAKALTLTLD